VYECADERNTTQQYQRDRSMTGYEGYMGNEKRKLDQCRI